MASAVSMVHSGIVGLGGGRQFKSEPDFGEGAKVLVPQTPSEHSDPTSFIGCLEELDGWMEIRNFLGSDQFASFDDLSLPQTDTFGPDDLFPDLPPLEPLEEKFVHRDIKPDIVSSDPITKEPVTIKLKKVVCPKLRVSNDFAPDFWTIPKCYPLEPDYDGIFKLTSPSMVYELPDMTPPSDPPQDVTLSPGSLTLREVLELDNADSLIVESLSPSSRRTSLSGFESTTSESDLGETKYINVVDSDEWSSSDENMTAICFGEGSSSNETVTAVGFDEGSSSYENVTAIYFHEGSSSDETVTEVDFDEGSSSDENVTGVGFNEGSSSDENVTVGGFNEGSSSNETVTMAGLDEVSCPDENMTGIHEMSYDDGNEAGPSVKKGRTRRGRYSNEVKYLRKKEQNKKAACRYREKKRLENKIMHDAVTKEEERRSQLVKEGVAIKQELNFVKKLMREMLVARKLVSPDAFS